MKSRSAHWVYLLLGFLWIAGVTYWYLTFLRGYCIHDILQDNSELGKINRYNFFVDLAYIPGSLLVTALLFYLAGRNWFTKFFGNENQVGVKNLANPANQDVLRKELDDCKKKYDDLLVKSSGDRIEKRNIESSLGASSGNANISGASALGTSSSSISTSGSDASTSGSENIASSHSNTSSIDQEIEAKKQELQAQQREVSGTSGDSGATATSGTSGSDSAAISGNSANAGDSSSITSAASGVAASSGATGTASGSTSSQSSGEESFDKGKAKEVFGKPIKFDDLKLVEGIGPKIESILKDKGITTWAELSVTDPQKIVDILLEEGGAAYKIHDPSTWPKQARLAAEGKFEELKSLQDNLKGGREL